MKHPLILVIGCPGNKHKQDRHNCSLMINWKLYLSDLDQWRIQITGSHVPIDSSVPWLLPYGEKERFDEDMRDLILECSEKSTQDAEIKEMIAQRQKFSSPGCIPSCVRIKRFRKNRLHKRRVRDQDVRKTLELKRSSQPVQSVGTHVTDDNIQTESGSSGFIDISSGVPTCPIVSHEGAPQIAAKEEQSSCSWKNPMPSSTDSERCIVYYDGSQIPHSMYTNVTNLNQTDTVSVGNTVTPGFQNSKTEQQLIPMEGHLRFVAANAGAHTVGNAGDIEIVSVPVSQIPPLDTGSHPIQLVPHMQTAMNVPILSVDAEGQPCYGNYGDIAFFVCPEGSNIPTQ